MQTTRIAAVGLVAISLSVIGFVGCGGSDSSSAGTDAATSATTPALTQAEFVAAANKVCADIRAKSAANGAKLDLTNLQSVKDAMATGLADAKAAVAELRAITPPVESAAVYRAYVAAQAAEVDAGDAVIAKVDSATTVKDALAAANADESASATRLAAATSAATAAGLTECAKS